LELESEVKKALKQLDLLIMPLVNLDFCIDFYLYMGDKVIKELVGWFATISIKMLF